MSDPQNPLSGVVYPGVYVEEVLYRARSIEGVGTTTTGFVGTAASGPVGTVSELLTSYDDFKAIYGEADTITYASGEIQKSYLAHAVASFFVNGGKRLYVVRMADERGANTIPPTATDYARALEALAAIEEIAIVAAPGGSVAGDVGPVHDALIAHVSRDRAYCFAVLDPPAGATITDVKAVRARLDCKNAALYYPWITVLAPSAPTRRPLPPLKPQPLLKKTINVPPSGAICGIYSRSDIERAVFKAPANEVINDAVGFEVVLTDGENEVLNPLGINCLRNFAGRGNRVWGARTVSSDAEWKYVNVRRYMLYLERSMDVGTQWVVFEPNSERLWAQVLAAVENFLFDEWRSGALQGMKPEEAYFVKCDRTTMTQNDIDNGRLIVEIGFAPLKPAEFVILRIGQWTCRDC